MFVVHNVYTGFTGQVHALSTSLIPFTSPSPLLCPPSFAPHLQMLCLPVQHLCSKVTGIIKDVGCSSMVESVFSM